MEPVKKFKDRAQAEEYLAYWQNGQTKVKYIGKDEESLEKVRNELAHRKYLQNEIRRLKDEYKKICKFIKE